MQESFGMQHLSTDLFINSLGENKVEISYSTDLRERHEIFLSKNEALQLLDQIQKAI